MNAFDAPMVANADPAGLLHVFTTVSDTTGKESESFIKHKPDMITPNELNVRRDLNEFIQVVGFVKGVQRCVALGYLTFNRRVDLELLFNWNVGQLFYLYSAPRMSTDGLYHHVSVKTGLGSKYKYIPSC